VTCVFPDHQLYSMTCPGCWWPPSLYVYHSVGIPISTFVYSWSGARIPDVLFWCVHTSSDSCRTYTHTVHGDVIFLTNTTKIIRQTQLLLRWYCLNRAVFFLIFTPLRQWRYTAKVTCHAHMPTWKSIVMFIIADRAHIRRVGGATQNIIVAAPYKCTNWFIDWLI